MDDNRCTVCDSKPVLNVAGAIRWCPLCGQAYGLPLDVATVDHPVLDVATLQVCAQCAEPVEKNADGSYIHTP